jgi:hypothetical protein
MKVFSFETSTKKVSFLYDFASQVLAIATSYQSLRKSYEVLKKRTLEQDNAYEKVRKKYSVNALLGADYQI